MSTVFKNIMFVFFVGLIALVILAPRIDMNTSKTLASGEMASIKEAKHSLKKIKKPPKLQAMADFEADTTEIFTRQMTADEAQSEIDQYDNAMNLLNGSKEDGRIEGVEQLGSLTSEESEMMLAKLLITDTNPDLRNSAAQSLETFELPLDSTITDLVSALQDESEDVRFSALSTLQTYMLRLEEGKESYKKIEQGLKAKAANQSIHVDTREAINDFLKAQ
jgi:hypothetical protein